jgi:16S rRNA (uracil1498-N3)-methyltransferase
LCLPRVPVPEEEIALGADFAAALPPWQPRPGEIFTAVDPEQGCWRVRLTVLGPEVRGVPFARLTRPVESPLELHIYQALPDKERFELVLQKLTELGVAHMVPVETTHSLTLVERDAVQGKSHRWPEVIVRAAKQCRRAMLPELGDVVSLDAALEAAGSAELKLIFYEGEEQWTVREALGSLRPQQIAVLVGPEGGFAEAEVAAARTAGFLPVSLGPRLLRTETAAIAAATLLQGLLGDLR